MNDLLNNPYGFLIVCGLATWTALICAFAATELMAKLFPCSPNHTRKRGASRMSNDELRKRLYK